MGLSASVSNSISADEQLIIVPPDESFEWAHRIMITRDRVHHIGSLQDLRTFYTGNADKADILQPGTSNKIAFALIAGENLRSVIYAHLITLPQDGKSIAFADVPGDTDIIRTTPATAIEDPAAINGVLFYAISNVADKDSDPGSRYSGQRLIEAVYPVFNALPMMVSTVSPTPKSADWLKENGEPRRESEIIERLIERASQNLDEVGKFHLSRGAVIGDIKLMPASGSDPNNYRGVKGITNYAYLDQRTTALLSEVYNRTGFMGMAAPLYERLPDQFRAKTFPVPERMYPHALFKGFSLDSAAIRQRAGLQTSRPDDSGLDMLAELHPVRSV